MPAHVFVVDEENYEICTRKGIVGLPEAKEKGHISDALISRMATVKDGDYILLYVTTAKELRGAWRALGKPFYETAPIWHGNDKIYPFRHRIECTEFSFAKPLRLNDIYNMQNLGKIWTWALRRGRVSNAMFSISNSEFHALQQEYLKINPFTMKKDDVMEPYPIRPPNLFEQIHREDGRQLPRFESSLMALLFQGFVGDEFKDVFGNYNDYVGYVPTDFGKEIDILLFFNNPMAEQQTISYDIIEAKSGSFDHKALKQLIDYESWLIHKKVFGDMNMVRVSAIAKQFTPDVKGYVKNRKELEGKEIKLLEYGTCDKGRLTLKRIE